ncbi:SNO glutamine amidotransferase family-domain-containing protein [Kockiozyma suomiensis]|uniref:SNO glutamine amidotransferase family-domain-containing protein n=1 Tax=Kockiozyma suomiensis TaxID=1337062 RepID=UPI0033442563
MTKKMVTIGVLALQGAFIEHINHLQKAAKSAKSGSLVAGVQIKAVQVRTVEQLKSVDALILPGGESTSISLIAERTGLLVPLQEFVRIKRKPVWGTCAGLILLSDQASKATKGGQKLVGGLHVRCQRNHFGRQTESFSCDLALPFIDPNDPDDRFSAMFIRAPIIDRLLDSDTTDNFEALSLSDENVVYAPKLEADSDDRTLVEVICRLPKTLGSEADDIVAVRQGQIFGTSFHPELTSDVRLHLWWMEECVLPYLE